MLRLIIPKADRSRGQYGLAVKKIAKQYIDALHLKGDDSNRLEHHDNPNYFEGCEGVVVGDFSSVLMYVLRNRVIPHNRQTSRWTIRDVNEKLDQLEKVSTNKEYNVIFSELIQHCSAKENKWFSYINGDQDVSGSEGILNAIKDFNFQGIGTAKETIPNYVP